MIHLLQTKIADTTNARSVTKPFSWFFRWGLETRLMVHDLVQSSENPYYYTIYDHICTLYCCTA